MLNKYRCNFLDPAEDVHINLIKREHYHCLVKEFFLTKYTKLQVSFTQLIIKKKRIK